MVIKNMLFNTSNVSSRQAMNPKNGGFEKGVRSFMKKQRRSLRVQKKFNSIFRAKKK